MSATIIIRNMVPEKPQPKKTLTMKKQRQVKKIYNKNHRVKELLLKSSMKRAFGNKSKIGKKKYFALWWKLKFNFQSKFHCRIKIQNLSLSKLSLSKSQNTIWILIFIQLEFQLLYRVESRKINRSFNAQQ